MGVDILDVMFRTEKTFGIKFPDQAIQKLETVEQLYQLVLETLPTSSLLNESGNCWKCDYDLRYLPKPRCPECGAQFFCEANSGRLAVWNILMESLEESLGVERDKINPDSNLLKDFA